MKTGLKACKWGQFLLLQGDMISQYVDLYGEWCEYEVAFFQDILSPDSNVIEVGANIGAHTIPLSHIVEGGKVLCFEPQRILYQILSANCALNNRTNIYALQKAVGDDEAILDIASTDYQENWNYGAFSIEKGFDSEQEFQGKQWTESVPLIRLDDCIEAKQLDAIRLIKIDVEGYEMAVLDGAKQLIQKHRPLLFVENNHPETGDDLIAKIASLGYNSYWYCAERFRPDNHNRVAQNVGGVDLNMICVPAEEAMDIGPLEPAIAFEDLQKGKVQLIRRNFPGASESESIVA